MFNGLSCWKSAET